MAVVNNFFMRQDYIDLKYKPKKNEVIALYYLEPARGVSFEEVANHLAGESSIDTWSDILTLSPSLASKLKPHVFFLNKKKKIIKVAYHLDLFEINSIPQILSALAGNIFSLETIKNLKLLDLSFPRELIKQFKGPKFGLNGIRKLLRVKNRPLIGTIIKPKVGLTPEQQAKVAYEAWSGGCDLVKDDENSTNQKFNQFKERAKLVLKARKKAEKETRERKMYLANITSPTCEEMLKRAKFVKDLGGEYVMIDIIPVGWTALQTLREANKDLNLVLHGHRCMHSVFTRDLKHGISMLVIAKLVRLLGLDQLHIGTVVGKMHGEKKEVLTVRDECVLKRIKENTPLNVLAQEWGKINPLFPVASGGLQPLMIPKLVKIFGKDIILQFGGGIHAHPMGTKAGAMACRQTLESTLKGISLKEAAEKHKELKVAIDKWGLIK